MFTNRIGIKPNAVYLYRPQPLCIDVQMYSIDVQMYSIDVQMYSIDVQMYSVWCLGGVCVGASHSSTTRTLPALCGDISRMGIRPAMH